MDLNSPIFDRIRNRSRRKAEEDAARAEAGKCQHVGCQAQGGYRAPKGRFQEGQYWSFCIDHVKAYNASYNYFDGMSDAAVSQYQKEAIVGHRPTWSMGVNSTAAHATKAAQAGTESGVYDDPLGLFRAGGFAGRAAKAKAEEAARPRVGPVARKALEKLDLDVTADSHSIKMAFKTLVKRLHPDANGGDRSTEDRLREIIDAYNVLKGAGLV